MISCSQIVQSIIFQADVMELNGAKLYTRLSRAIQQEQLQTNRRKCCPPEIFHDFKEKFWKS